MFVQILLFILFLIILYHFFFLVIRSRRRPPSAESANENAPKLPPGTMGLPFVGETLKLYTQNPNVFFSTRHKRYGEIFKTHVLGCPCVMLASPEAARFVLVTHAELFNPTYPPTKMDLIGPSALFFHSGAKHARLRKVIQASLAPESVRSGISVIDSAAISALNMLSHGKVVRTFAELKKYSFEVGIISIFGNLDEKIKAELKRNYSLVDRGYNSFPNRIPGSAYQNAIKARKRLGEILRSIIKERRCKGEVKKDLLGSLMNMREVNNGGESSNDQHEEHELMMSDEEASDNVIGVLFAAQDTTASVLTWLLKYLHDTPNVLGSVLAEQKAVYEENELGKKSLTWAQTRNMPFTSKVIMETLRKASILSFTFREAVVNVEYKGYLIPKGWKVLPLFRNIHHNPDFFPDPQIFDPSRFQLAPKPNTFLPFGSGVHSCPGNELAKLEIIVFLHHLVNEYRWEVVGCKDGIEYCPFPVPKRGLRAKFWKFPTNITQNGGR